MSETCGKENSKIDGRLSNGRFAPGISGNPKGNNQFSTLAPLIEALKYAGKKRGEDFWDMVAQRVWQHETVLIAVLKKLLPDKVKDETPPTTINIFVQNIFKKAGLIDDSTRNDESQSSKIQNRFN